MQLTLTIGGIDITATSVAEVHQLLSRHAAEIANQDPRLSQLVDHPHGVWREASVKSEVVPGRGLCIEYDEALMEGRNDAWKEAMAQIGRDAMQRALVANASVFVGLSIGEGREGRNYWRMFPARPPEHKQEALF